LETAATPLAELLAEGARRESEARVRLVVADWAAVRPLARALATGGRDPAPEEAGIGDGCPTVEGVARRAALCARLHPCALAAGDLDAARDLLGRIARDTLRIDPRAAGSQVAPVARILVAACAGDATAPGASGATHAWLARAISAAGDASAGSTNGCTSPTELAAAVGLLAQAFASGVVAPGDDAGRLHRSMGRGLDALLAIQRDDGAWIESADGSDATARVLDDALAAPLVGAQPSPHLAAAAARALARLAATQSRAGDWAADRRRTIDNARAAMLVLPLLAAGAPSIVRAAGFAPEDADGRFAERAVAWSLAARPELGFPGPGPDPIAADEALEFAAAGIGLLLDHGAWRASDPRAVARLRGLA